MNRDADMEQRDRDMVVMSLFGVGCGATEPHSRDADPAALDETNGRGRCVSSIIIVTYHNHLICLITGFMS